MNVRLTKEQNNELKQQAKLAGMSVSDYVRSVLFPAGTKTQKEQQANEKMDRLEAKIQTLSAAVAAIADGLNAIDNAVAKNSNDLFYNIIATQQVVIQKIIRDESRGYGQKTVKAVNYAQEILDDAYNETDKQFTQK